MVAEAWYVVDDGKVLGPLAVSDLVAMAATKTVPLLVWTEGFADWTEAHEVEALRTVLSRTQSPTNDEAPVQSKQKPSLKDRARRELIEYAAISAYLYVCFGALTIYKAAILRGQGISFAPYGFALAKALILGKFLLLLRAAKIGRRKSGGGRMVVDIARDALIFAALLGVLDVLEEIIVGWIHGKSSAVVLAEMTGDSGLQVLATALLLVLVLIPYFAFHEITERLGEGSLVHMLVERHGPSGDPERRGRKERRQRQRDVEGQ
jgi:hypothetical protein